MNEKKKYISEFVLTPEQRKLLYLLSKKHNVEESEIILIFNTLCKTIIELIKNQEKDIEGKFIIKDSHSIPIPGFGRFIYDKTKVKAINKTLKNARNKF